MERLASSKPSLSQQFLRTFRPRASTTAAPFTSSTTASPLSTPIDHDVVSGLGSGDAINTFSPIDILDRNALLLAKSQSLSINDFQAYISELSKPILAEDGSEQRDSILADRMQMMQILILSLNKKIEEEEAQDETQVLERDTQQITSSSFSSGPPQSEVFKLCLHLLVQAREGALPLPLRLGVCELTTASVKLSDVRANKGTKAVRETRSGAPGSQSSKVVDADHPLANIDRAALYDLVCHLSDGYEADVPTKDNWHQSQLPALPVQLKALGVLSYEGRDVFSFPGILEFLSQALEVVWKELQILRRLPRNGDESGQGQTAETNGGDQGDIKLIEQLSAREWSLSATLHLITSIIKFGFAFLDLQNIETVLNRMANMLLGTAPQPRKQGFKSVPSSPTSRAHARNRSKSKEKKPLTEGYDYYGLESLSPGEQSPFLSPTPRSALTPKMGPKTADLSSVAPIALATLAPSSLANVGTSRVKVAEQPILQASDVRAVLMLIDAILRYGCIPPGSVDSMVNIVCGILGYQHQGEGQDDDWSSLVTPVMENLLKGHCANASLRAVRNMLMDASQVASDQITILVGAIAFLRSALTLVAKHGGSSQIGMVGSTEADSALAPSLSLPLLLPALEGALQRHVDVLDLHVLRLVSDMLPLTSSSEPSTTASPLIGSLTLDDWDSLLDLTVVARRHTQGWKLRGDATGLLDQRSSPSEQTDAQPPTVIMAMLELISRLRLAPPGGTEESTRLDRGLPWTPKLAALLLSLAPLLPDSLMNDLVLFYKVHDFCLPWTPEWITNIRSLLAAFFHRHQMVSNDFGASSAPQPRRSLVALVFEHVYEIVQDLPEHRCTLMLEVILPLAQSALASESDEVIEGTIRAVLVEAAATAISQSPGISATARLAKEGEALQESEKPDSNHEIFFEVCDLFGKLARSASPLSTPSSRAALSNLKDSTQPHVSFVDPPGVHEHKTTTRTHSRANSISDDASAAVPPKMSKQCRSALDLIAIFNRLAFSSPWVLLSLFIAKKEERTGSQWEKSARESCLFLFRRMLEMVQPEGEDIPSVSVRLTILQWLVRLRTDGQHRVYLAENMDELIAPAATSILRGVASGSDATVTDTQLTNERPRGSRRPAADSVPPSSYTGREGGREAEKVTSRAERSISRVREASRDRGRSEQSPLLGSERDRSSSRTRTGASTVPRQAGVELPQQQPLWRLPDVVLFEVPGSKLRSDVVYTYKHAKQDGWDHHSHTLKEDETPNPLPISEYMATCIMILEKERDWDLVSYLLCHLPHQLANKHLFCGPRAQKQILALRQMLTTNILDQKFVNQVNLPEKVKKSDVYTISYGTLTTLISYRALFSRSQQDELVEAFMAGLNKSSNTAQPCVRALSVACYELQKSINRHLPKMLVKLTTVMSSNALSVHILELIAAIGHLPSLYANFTETDFRRIFGIALQYIQYHNQDQQNREQDQQSFKATSFTLSQYVIMLAYYNISLWFMSLRINDRAKFVESIRKGLIAANEGREKVADQTEVCFDFLARFTYSNAEPRPKQSFLNLIVKANNADKDYNANSKTYLYGKGLVTVTSLKKSGWAELLVRRSSGTIGLLCKLENAAVSQLPDEDGEKVDLPAALMMDRISLRQPRLSIVERTREQLRIGDQLREQHVRGPASFALVKKARSASFSEGIDGEGGAMAVVRKELDAYSRPIGQVGEQGEVADEVDEVEMDRVKESMEEVLGASPDSSKHDLTDEYRAKSPVSALRNFHMDPGFLALQLSSFPDIAGSDRGPILLPNEPSTQRTIRSIDLTPVVDFHKIGVLYVGSGQTTEREILGNRSGSRNYTNFLSGLGELVTLKGQQDVYTGGLDTRNDEHGRYAYVWGDDISQIVYHITTLMPNHLALDENHSGKKALIGNDWVRIVWNESGREYDFNTIKTQFNFINIVISPTSRGGGEVGSVNALDTLFCGCLT